MSWSQTVSRWLVHLCWETNLVTHISALCLGSTNYWNTHTHRFLHTGFHRHGRPLGVLTICVNNVWICLCLHAGPALSWHPSRTKPSSSLKLGQAGSSPSAPSGKNGAWVEDRKATWWSTVRQFWVLNFPNFPVNSKSLSFSAECSKSHREEVKYHQYKYIIAINVFKKQHVKWNCG